MREVLEGVQVVRTNQRRKTLSLEVHPSGQVWVRAPHDCDELRLRAFVAKRLAWIAAQRAYFQQFDPRTPARAWVAGETHLHRGRSYKLKLLVGPQASVALVGTDLQVTLTAERGHDAAAISSLVERWRHQQARIAFPALLAECLRHYRFQGLAAPSLRVQRLSKRWGSLSASGNMTLHTGLIQAPASCIRYVIFHELCHLLQPDHSPAFFALLGEVCPKWEQLKWRLETALR